ncbi:MAG TPA: hypothetical protein VFB78_10185 [Acidimicrobiales bacterium]|nr:hypothetical protein [Acidimicrobiales bacterium]
MSMLPDDIYDVFIIDAIDDERAHAVRLELTVTSGAHKGDVITLRATQLDRDPIDLIGLPARLHVRAGVPTVDFEEG